VDLAQGELLGGRYALGELLGRGGMGEVRAAKDLRLGRHVAVKLLRPELADQDLVRRRFEGEGRAAARLCHPNVATVYDVGEHEGTPFLVMERVHGQGLDRELAAGPLAATRARHIFSEVLAALGAAHSAGLVHRDVKPANVLLAGDDTVKVVDFGIAKALDADEDGHEVNATRTGQIVGTIAYMAPELVTGAPASVQSDVYSVGVMLYEALAGARPYPADTPVRMARTIVHTRPGPLATAHPGVDPGLAAVVERAMARRPEDRFSTAADMAAALSVAPAAPTDAAPTVVAHPPTELLTVQVDPAAPPPFHPGTAETAARRAATTTGHARSAPSGRPRRLLGAGIVAGLVVAGMVWLIAGDGDQPTGNQPAAETPAPPSSGIPTPLDDALDRLTEVVR
jgi:serine/threonine-protein kinase